MNNWKKQIIVILKSLFNFFVFMLYMLIDWIKNIFALINEILIRVVKITGYVAKNYKYGVHAVIFFYTSLVLSISWYVFRQDINNLIFIGKIYAQERAIEALEKDLSEENQWYEEQLKIIKDKLYKIVDLEYNQCIEKEVLKYKKYRLELKEIPSDLEIELAKIDGKANCAKIDVNNKIYSDIMNTPFKEILTKEIEVIETKREKEGVEEMAKEETIKTEIAQKEIAKDENQNNRFDVSDDYKNLKSQSQIKALFCSFWHGKSSKNPEWNDNGAIKYEIKNSPKIIEAIKKVFPKDIADQMIAQDYITERDIVNHINLIACQKVKEEGEKRGLKVYIIWQERMSLTDKIALINKISEENGYTRDNSLAYELHLNMLRHKPEVNGVEVWFASTKKGEEIKDWPNFAKKMLYEIATLYNQKEREGKHLFAKNDAISRHGYLGFISSTIPNSLIVEYGFLSNDNDIIYNLNNNQKIAETLKNGMINFLP